MKNVKGTISQTTITLKYEGVTIYVKKETDNLLFEECKHVLENGTDEDIRALFLDVKGRLEKYTNEIFTVENEQIMLKGDEVRIPDLLAEKLMEMEKNKEDFMPLIRFWKKLKENPSQESIDQLYGFLVHNNIPITETGDIVTEKGVNQLRGGLPDQLVDSYTGTVDNSIGSEVSMPRELVDADPTNTCSVGLHVGAPQYVRKWYNNEIIVQCIVNPRDVVSVPTDYNNTKMRVCRYVVAGFSPLNNKGKMVMKLEDFLTNAPEGVLDRSEDDKKAKSGSNTGRAKTKKAKKSDLKVGKKFITKAKKAIKGLSGSKIMKFVAEETGVQMTYNPKSKSTIVKKAIEVLSQHYEVKATA